jgi:hypothetical protein
VSIFSISIFLFALWRCNPMLEPKDDKVMAVTQVKRDLKSEKETIATDLRDWSNNIDRRITTIDENIGKANDKTTVALRELRTRLKKEKTKVDRSLKDVEKSTEKSWTEVRKHSNEILTEAKIEVQKIEERVEDLID